ncbi:hypothetical protein TcCL_Unassigned01111 [Trypanosoma cruzi]|uniref:Uncharacterized protein n=1 Tax=Trypanosoma cruzi (strain CL Brener) TaxID=353153 RepID=Q4D8P4_TRYCC|nr:hypothetical protein Tc00.1047053510475.10 [Trypanosoma cruzi]EAN88886.1 hypothetical protein Tc00.1047053510475.10 [Trypanosoma cruzi]RNC35964.1 hypothetical protein TcCL_Unassigned01111 [Trypanosoma cruzi]|eukprot:XP_810737.1 hypothetical protein [Trypanosoma cruzi strain CL Brener]
MINTSLADGILRSCWEMGTPLPSADTGRTHAAQRKLSATPAALCPASGERRTGPPPPVSTAGTPPASAWIHATTHGLGVGDACECDEAARGLSGCIAVECERRRGIIPRCTVAVAALSPSRSASRLRSTPLAMGECWLCSAGSRAWAVAPNAGSAITCETAALG